MKLRRLNTGNYIGSHKRHYFFVYKKPHGAWCCRIGKAGMWLHSEGVHGTFLSNLKKVKAWVRSKLITPPAK